MYMYVYIYMCIYIYIYIVVSIAVIIIGRQVLAREEHSGLQGVQGHCLSIIRIRYLVPRMVCLYHF